LKNDFNISELSKNLTEEVQGRKRVCPTKLRDRE